MRRARREDWAPAPAAPRAPSIRSACAAGRRLLGACHSPRPASALLLVNLCNSEPGANCNLEQDGVFRVAWHAQGVCLLPGSDANVRRIRPRVLLGEYQLPFVQALFRFVGHAFGVSPDEVGGGTRCGWFFVHEVCGRDVAVTM